MKQLDLPLWNFYHALNELHPFKLGTDNYFLMYEALQKGNNQIDFDELYFLCRLLWFKPERYKVETFDKLFQDYFNALRTQRVQERRAKEEAEALKNKGGAEDRVKEEGTTQEDEAEEEQQTSRNVTQNDTQQVVQDKVETVYIKPLNEVEVKEKTAKNTLTTTLTTKKYTLSGTYYNLTQRAMQQGWRTLRNIEVIKNTKKIDLNGTVAKVAKYGFLKELAYQPQLLNRTHLIMLIDNSPSMVAFQDLVEQLIKTARADKGIKHCAVYYFNNVPERYLFLDKKRHKRIRVTDLQADSGSSIFIISDAGAARGRLNEDRIELTEEFLAPYRYMKLAWLNPMPERRWIDSSASYIATMTNMLEVSDFNFKNVTKLLKGKIRVS